jgi:integrase
METLMFSSGFGLRPPHLGGDDRAEPVQIRGGQEKMLGHASAAMTLDIYADLFDDDLEAVATALDQARTRSRRVGH